MLDQLQIQQDLPLRQLSTEPIPITQPLDLIGPHIEKTRF